LLDATRDMEPEPPPVMFVEKSPASTAAATPPSVLERISLPSVTVAP